MPGATWRRRPHAPRRASASRWGMRAVSSSDRPGGRVREAAQAVRREEDDLGGAGDGQAVDQIQVHRAGPPAAAESSTAAGAGGRGSAVPGRAGGRPPTRARLRGDRVEFLPAGRPAQVLRTQPLDDARSAMPKATRGSEPIEALLKEGRKFPPPKAFTKAARVKSAGDLRRGEAQPRCGSGSVRRGSSGGSSRGGRPSSGSCPTRSGSSAGSSTSPTTAWTATSRARGGTRPRSSGRGSRGTAAS